MIDPTGERTIVTFHDPELWKVELPDSKLTASFLAGTRGPRGTIWLDKHGELQETLFPFTPLTRTGDVFHGGLHTGDY